MSKMTKTVATLGVVAGLGVAMLPLGAYAANSGDPVSNGPSAGPVAVDVEFQAEVKETIEISAADDLVDAGEVTSAKVNEEGKTTVTIHTNNPNGYKATIAASTGVTRAEDGTTSGTASANMIGDASTSNIIAGGVPTAGTSAWGYKIGSIDSYVAADTEPAQFADTSAVSTENTGDVYNLNFAVSVKPSQAADVYKGQVTLTATANPAPTEEP